MVSTVLAFGLMAEANTEKSLTIKLPADLHDAFFLKCFQSKPRVTMKQRIADLIARDVGLPPHRFVDRRKMTQAERDKLDKGK